MCRVHHEKCWARRSTSWNQDWWEKNQQSKNDYTTKAIYRFNAMPIKLSIAIFRVRTKKNTLFMETHHLTCLLRNLYAGQEGTVRTGLGTTDWFQIGKVVCHGCILSPWLFNLYAEYITRSTGLEEAQSGIKIAGRNINNLRYADDTTLMAESEELNNLSMKVKEKSEKVG